MPAAGRGDCDVACNVPSCCAHSAALRVVCAQCCFVGDLLGIGPHMIINSMACCDGYSYWCKEYQVGIRQWLEMVNRELPSPALAKILSYRVLGTWAWVLEFATTEEAVRAAQCIPSLC